MDKIEVEEVLEEELENKPIKVGIRLADGTKVPGATTIISQLNMPYLLKWANKLGLQGIEYDSYMKGQANVGKLFHSILESYYFKTEVDLTKYNQPEISEAEYMFFNKYKEWEANKEIEPILSEKELVSESYKYGGIIDFYGKIDGKYYLIDFKTSKRIYNSTLLQLSSYVQLLRENNYQVDYAMILNVPKGWGGKVECKHLTPEDNSIYFNIFKILVDLHWAKKGVPL